MRRGLKLYRDIARAQNQALSSHPLQDLRAARVELRDEFRKHAHLTLEKELQECYANGEAYLDALRSLSLGGTSNVAFGTEAYWEAYYSQDTVLTEWIATYEDIEPFLPPLQQDERINKVLVFGCGLSELGFRVLQQIRPRGGSVLQVDVAESVVSEMNEYYEFVKGLTTVKADLIAGDDPAPGMLFDLILDKGTIDAVVSGENASENLVRMEKRFHDLLSPQGTYFMATFIKPEHCSQVLAPFHSDRWRVEHKGSVDNKAHIYWIVKQGN